MSVMIVEQILETLPHPSATPAISFAARMGDGSVKQFIFPQRRVALTLAHALEGLYHAGEPKAPSHGGTSEAEDPPGWEPANY